MSEARGYVRTGNPGAPTRAATPEDVADDNTPVFAYPTAFTPRKDPHPDAPQPEHDRSDFSWSERDPQRPTRKVRHIGTEYEFPAETGLPPLRTEWVPRTDGASYGVGVLFLATAHPDTGGGPSSEFTWDRGAEHPDNEQHFRDTLYEPWNLLFPDKSEVWYDANLNIVNEGTEGAQLITIADVVDEAVRRYRNWLHAAHPSQIDTMVADAEQLRTEIDLSAQALNELVSEIAAEDPEVAPLTVIVTDGPPPEPKPAPVPEPVPNEG